jgi:Trk K+ transport system NAD-binding subunit
MGALIAGIAISTFPYNLDVIAKVVNIRDFFVTLFFVSLGMQIPNPLNNTSVLLTAAITSLFLVSTRFLAIFPVLYSLKNGLRVSLLTSVNLSQISEFSLVIAALGVTAGHITQDTMSIVIFVFVITSVSSTYMIKYNDNIQKSLSVVLKKSGIKDLQSLPAENKEKAGKEIALLGFYRNASSLLHELINKAEDGNGSLKDKLLVIDFNPEIHVKLRHLGVQAVYGDISHPDTLHHAGLHDVKIIISTIPDTVLVGTDNLKIIRHMREICPHARIIVTAESIERALKMYSEGADYVFLPRILSGKKVNDLIRMLLDNKEQEFNEIIAREVEALRSRQEIIS